MLCAEPKEHKHFRPGTRPGGIGFPAGRIGDRGDREIVYVPDVYVPFPAPTLPVLPFLVFFGEFLVFFPCEEFLVFSSVFPFFSRDFRGSVGIKNPCFFGGLPCLYPKKKKARKGRTGCLLVRVPNRRASALQLLGSSQSTCPEGPFEFYWNVVSMSENEPQSRNRQIINLREKWGFRRFQKERLKVCKTALFAHFLRKKCGLHTFRCSFWNRRKPHF